MSFIHTSINSEGTFEDFLKAIRDFFLNNNCCKFELEEDIKIEDSTMFFIVCKSNLKIKFYSSQFGTGTQTFSTLKYEISFKENKQSYSRGISFINNNIGGNTKDLRTMNIFLSYSLEESIISFSFLEYNNSFTWASSSDDYLKSFIYFEKQRLLFYSRYNSNDYFVFAFGIDLNQEMLILLKSLLLYPNKDNSKIIFLNKVNCIESNTSSFLYFLEPFVSIDKNDSPNKVYRINEENYLIVQPHIGFPIGERIEYIPTA